MITAVVLTFEAPVNLERCLRAISQQTLLPDRVVVVENPGSATLPDLRQLTTLPVRHIRLSDNEGPAGGFAAGLRAVEADDLWLLDDDVFPEPNCLETLCADLSDRDRKAVVFPTLRDGSTGEECNSWGWVGVLVPREAADAVGVPDARLFYGSEDQDYLIDRCGTAGFPLTRSTAPASMTRRPGGHHPEWHFYYLARNALYQALYRRRHLAPTHRIKRMLATEWDLARSAGFRPRAWCYFALGLLHGSLGILGRRIEPGPRVLTD